MSIQNVIFDLDGTLIDSFPGIEQAYRHAVAAILPESEIPEIKNMIGPPIDKIFRNSLHVGAEFLIEELVQEFKKTYDSFSWQNTIVYEGVKELLLNLKKENYNLFIVTNKRHHPTLKIVSHFGLNHFFTEILSPDAYDLQFASKKQALSFLLNKYKITPKKAIFVGDSKDDIEAAQENDLIFVSADYGYGKISLNKNYTVTFTMGQPLELITILNKINFS